MKGGRVGGNVKYYETFLLVMFLLECSRIILDL